ncbi:(Fe-S)-binding protein [Desulfopila sp. IMCC35006]|nr:(Fe-S)-binding protein [Desulfopila sp. IMCC35006]
MTQYGTPRTISTLFDFNAQQQRQVAYHCSLCGLCTAVCPEKVDPCAMFLAIRRYHVESGSFDARPYRSLFWYERLGGSRLFSWYGLPDACDTIFFPGCSLSGTRPEVTWQLYQLLRRFIPSLGIILACCAKPSHDFGCMEHFQSVFGGLSHRLSARGVKTVLTACPSCTKIFRDYGKGLSVMTVYEILQRQGGAKNIGTSGCSGEISVHDPCQLRDYPEVQSAIRSLLVDLGYTVVEMRHRGKTTLCCGEGGAVGCMEPRLSRGWMEKRRQESENRRLVSYCAGCTGSLGRVTPTFHVLDLLFLRYGASERKISVSRGLMTYLNRLLLKLRLARVKKICR